MAANTITTIITIMVTETGRMVMSTTTNMKIMRDTITPGTSMRRLMTSTSINIVIMNIKSMTTRPISMVHPLRMMLTKDTITATTPKAGKEKIAIMTIPMSMTISIRLIKEAITPATATIIITPMKAMTIADIVTITGTEATITAIWISCRWWR
jgi:hypothetical protein